MIIKNPYNAIIKHFRLINFLILIPMIYLVFKFGDIAGFFNDYVSQGYTTHETNFADSYITALSFAVPIIMIIVNSILYFIFGSKKKNNIIYGISVLYYIVLLIGLIIFGSAMSSIERESLDPTFANFVRDCSYIAYYPLFILIIITIINASGFNIKTFRFDNFADLKVNDEEDEIEIRVGHEDNSLKKNIVHLIRELKYYVLENKFVFACICVLLLLIVGYTTYTNYRVYNRTYASNQAIVIDNFAVSVKESYLTNVDYQGQIIAEDTYFLAVKIGVENKGVATPIDSSYFRLYVGDDVIFPSYDRSARFVDIAATYQGESIPKGTSKEYVFVYELNSDQIKNSYQIRILNEAPVIKNNKLVSKYKKINVRPQNIIKKQSIGDAELGEEVSLKNTTLGNTTIKIKNFSVNSSYKYERESCNSNNICSTISDTIVPSSGKALIIFEDELTWDKETSYYINSNPDFYKDFVTLYYEYNIEYGRDKGLKKLYTTIKNVTPKSLTNIKIYEVPNTILKANKISMEVKIRNNILKINVKD